MVSRFFTEARAATRIGHSNIIEVMDFGQTPDGLNYIVMELLEGLTLGDRLKLEGELSIDSAQHISLQLTAGLQASHAVGIIHRDLKPDNIFLIDRDGDAEFVKILDFGLAKLTQGGGGALAHKTRSGSVLGTPHYMSPEQCEGKAVDDRADIYSLGCIIFQMVTGRVPFPGDGFGEVLIKHLRELPPMPSKLNPKTTPSLERIILHALAKKPEFRFQTMEEFRIALTNPERFGRALEGEGLTRDTFEVLNPDFAARQNITLSDDMLQPTGEDFAPAGARRVTDEDFAPPGADVVMMQQPIDLDERQITLREDVATSLHQIAAKKKSGGPGLIVAGAMILLGVAAGALALGLTPRYAEVLVTSQPAGAQLYFDGRMLGQTPLMTRLPTARAPWSVILRKEGFDDTPQVLHRGKSNVEINLKALATPAPPVVVVPPEPAIVKTTPPPSPVVLHETTPRVEHKPAPIPKEKPPTAELPKYKPKSRVKSSPPAADEVATPKPRREATTPKPRNDTLLVPDF